MKTHGKYGVTAMAAAQALCEDVRNFSTRRRNIMYLMHRYLVENGFYSSAEALKSEGSLSEEYELCDNIDLDGMYLEYASFFNMKFGKYPKILKKVGPKIKVEMVAGKGQQPKQQQEKDKSEKLEKLEKLEKVPAKHTQNEAAGSLANWHMGVGAAKVAASLNPHSYSQSQQDNSNASNPLQIRKMETPVESGSPGDGPNAKLVGEIEHGHLGGDDSLFASMDWQSLAELVKTSILREDIQLRWSDVCGNQRAIELIKEAVLTPIEYPQLFAHGLKPWRSLLLHGPPGSGKTFLAKALYAETRGQVTFFNITASIMVSKWRGESEKILRVLFHMAAKRAPSVIFLDEIESLTSKRDRVTDHESSKRFKNELLQLLDGMEHTLKGVFVLASTNLPWDIDEAFLRRFEKKLLVQLPNQAERSSLIGRLLGASITLTPKLLEHLVKISDQFTGDEIRLACKEVSMQRVRCATTNKLLPGAAKDSPAAVSEANVEKAFKMVRPLGQKLLAKHEQWQQENGS